MLTQNNTLIIGGLIWMSIASIVFYEVLNWRRPLSSPPLSSSLETKILHKTFSPANETALTKEALDALVEQAAKHQLLKKAFGQPLTYTKLPQNKKTFELQRPISEIEISRVQTPLIQTKMNPHRCQYQNQTYVPGDTINTDQGWVRCVTAVTFDDHKLKDQQISNPIWVLIK